MSDFGRRTYVSGFAFHGSTDPEAVSHLVLKVIADIGMTPIFDKKIFEWTEDGVGYIHVQCLYESCVIADVWPKHNGGYLLVVSCKKYDLDAITKAMHDLGYMVVVAQDFPLWLL